MKTDFSPCPFCGPQQVKPQAFDTEEGSSIRCMSCGGSTDDYVDTESAAEAWNTRAPQWLPIESAPKDGSTILVFGKAYRTPGKPSQPYPARWSRGWWMEGASVVIEYATHWQPLPAPPEVQP